MLKEKRYQTTFQRINRKWFDNSLPTVPIVADLSTRVRVMMGYIEFEDKGRSKPKIVIYTKWNKDDEILAHEMIHLYQVINKKSTRHTQEFYDLEQQIVQWLKKRA